MTTPSMKAPAAAPEAPGRHSDLRFDAVFARELGAPAADAAKRDLATMVREMTSLSIKDIDALIANLQSLKKHLQAEGDRVYADVADYAKLVQGATTGTNTLAQSIARLRDERSGC